MPRSLPSTAITQGSLWVVMASNRLPKRRATSRAIAHEVLDGSRAAQPPRSCRVCGRSQWLSVRKALRPRAQAFDQALVEGKAGFVPGALAQGCTRGQEMLKR